MRTTFTVGTLCPLHTKVNYLTVMMSAQNISLPPAHLEALSSNPCIRRQRTVDRRQRSPESDSACGDRSRPTTALQGTSAHTMRRSANTGSTRSRIRYRRAHTTTQGRTVALSSSPRYANAIHQRWLQPLR